jgi:hypothetical protein
MGGLLGWHQYPRRWGLLHPLPVLTYNYTIALFCYDAAEELLLHRKTPTEECVSSICAS